MIKEFLKLAEELDYGFFINEVDCMWTINGYQILWNSDNNEEDLFYETGNTYSGLIYESFNLRKKIGDYLLIDIDTQMGFKETLILNKNKKVSYEELEELYG